MEKVVQRSKIVHRHAAKRLSKEIDHLEKGKSWNRKRDSLRIRGDNHALIVTARKERAEAWSRGLLAPRRDVGDKAKTHGALSLYSFNLPDRHPRSLPKWYWVSEGDRVVVTKGREKGKIAEVEEVQKEKGAVRLKGVNVADVAVPSWVNQRDTTEKDSVQPIAIMVPVEDVRLVYPLPDPTTGKLRDVVVEKLICVNREWDKVKREWDRGMRAVPGTNTLIPWPEVIEPEFQDHEDDTLRRSVDEVTHTPLLLNWPMPASVIDELRNKYSKFRTRHSYEFTQKIEAQAAKEEKRKDLHLTMRTPLQELAEVRRKAKAAESRELTDEQLAKIGEVMASEAAKRGKVASALA
ncbi:hypothetical protein B0A48_17449 [Cryoendolithus antarcticus]|uniref:KOW domain-containing protein n=1 Tax=Cryoendolithus antarcticus TaxID=1507870 RepID=A0A1V8SCL7_9PEZI|nr:hypothetical protein B0A48_17449 [Cryoendolithus antarcticus]